MNSTEREQRGIKHSQVAIWMREGCIERTFIFDRIELGMRDLAVRMGNNHGYKNKSRVS